MTFGTTINNLKEIFDTINLSFKLQVLGASLLVNGYKHDLVTILTKVISFYTYYFERPAEI